MPNPQRVLFPYCILIYWFHEISARYSYPIMGTQTGQNDRKAGEATTHVNLTTISQFTNTTKMYNFFVYVKQIFFTQILNPTSVSNLINQSLKNNCACLGVIEMEGVIAISPTQKTKIANGHICSTVYCICFHIHFLP